MFDFLHLNPLSHVVDAVADRTCVCSSSDGRAQAHTALLAGKLRRVGLAVHGVNGLMADRALGVFTLALVKDHVVAAVRALTAGHNLRADVDNVAAGALDFLPGEESGASLSEASAGGTFYYEF